MTLYKIFKENEEKHNQISTVMVLNKMGYRGSKEFYKDMEKNAQLALIDGVIAMVEELDTVTWRSYADRFKRNDAPTAEVSGYEQALSDLKDKLLAERKLIEENEIHSNKQ